MLFFQPNSTELSYINLAMEQFSLFSLVNMTVLLQVCEHGIVRRLIQP